jgi:hypothetical protein
MPTLDADIDRLYQLPLDQFTAERNALAKRAGPTGPDIRKLTKPPLAAWAVNQLYWRERGVYETLIEASQELRAAHKAVLGGGKADLRGAGRSHDDAVDAAFKATQAIVGDDGHPVTDATRQAIANTLRALPGDEPPGRLSQTLQPGGFEMLAGVTPARRPAAAAPAKGKDTSAPQGAARAAKGDAARPSPAAAARARSEAAAATRAVREAETAARREEFESARAARDAERAERNLTTARRALEEAQRELEEAEAEAAQAVERREAAAARAAAADEALAAAREREKRAKGAV